VATFRMGFLEPGDWQAKWIGAKGKHVRIWPNGFHALEAKADTPKWVAVDLGKSVAIDRIRLHPARPNNWKADVAGFGFPPVGRVEVAEDGEFKKITFAEKWNDGQKLIDGDKPVEFEVKGAKARFVRVTSEKLWKRADGSLCFALAELEIFSGGRTWRLGQRFRRPIRWRTRVGGRKRG
jgi:hypothetical protein